MVVAGAKEPATTELRETTTSDSRTRADSSPRHAFGREARTPTARLAPRPGTTTRREEATTRTTMTTDEVAAAVVTAGEGTRLARGSLRGEAAVMADSSSNRRTMCRPRCPQGRPAMVRRSIMAQFTTVYLYGRVFTCTYVCTGMRDAEGVDAL